MKGIELWRYACWEIAEHNVVIARERAITLVTDRLIPWMIMTERSVGE